MHRESSIEEEGVYTKVGSFSAMDLVTLSSHLSLAGVGGVWGMRVVFGLEFLVFQDCGRFLTRCRSAFGAFFFSENLHFFASRVWVFPLPREYAGTLHTTICGDSNLCCACL